MSEEEPASTYLIITIEDDHDEPYGEKPIGMHRTNVISDKCVIGDSHHTENQEIQPKQHFQKTKDGIIFT